MPMSRFSRVNTIWRKELIDTLRDRRTLIAMVLVPLVLYPALMLGSLQALEVQVSALAREEYRVAVADEAAAGWLRRVIDSDPARRDPPAAAPATSEADGNGGKAGGGGRRRSESATSGAREVPPDYKLYVVKDVQAAVVGGEFQVGLLIDGPLPQPGQPGSSQATIVYDDTEIRSAIAAAGVQGVLERVNARLVAERLAKLQIDPSVLVPMALRDRNVASAQKTAGSALGQIVPLILIIMTITGAIYPAIDLTAGERERGTLETLMVAPVPTIDLIFGKFIVVALIGMLSATLNLLSIGGTIYLGGLGQLLTPGSGFVFPLGALPWILVLLVPLSVMFAAALLAVCSFARSFKEAQNYVMPVMMAALIPGVVGVLPGTRLEGPLLVMPVANIVVLTRDLFMGRFDLAAIIWVGGSTSLYAAVAIAIAAQLFGKEAVLFADAGSIRTIFQRRFFRPRATPTVAAALLVAALAYTLNFYIQQSLPRMNIQGIDLLAVSCLSLVLLFGLGALFAARYLRYQVPTTFYLRRPTTAGIAAGLLLGVSTWLLARAWLMFQATWMPMDPRAVEMMQSQFAFIETANPWVLVFLLALVPALCEEWLYRGFVVSGLRCGLGAAAAIALSAMAFGLNHHSAHRLIVTTALGVVLALLVIRFGSLLPAILAHFLHNAISFLSDRADILQPMLVAWNVIDADRNPNAWALLAAGGAVLAALALCALFPSDPGRNPALPKSQPQGPADSGRRALA